MSQSIVFEDIDFLTPQQRARLVASTKITEVKAGDTLFSENEEATALYFLQDGHVELQNDSTTRSIDVGGCFGTETGCGLHHYLFNAQAKTACTVIKISRRDLLDVMGSTKQFLQKKFLQHYLKMFYNKNMVLPYKHSDPVKGEDSFLWQILGWGLAAFVPYLVFNLLSSSDLNHQCRMFLSILTVWSVVSAFRLMPHYVTTMTAVLLLVGGGVVQTQVILAGFSSSGFIIAIGLLGLSSVLVSSGVIYRGLIWLFSRLKPSTWKDNLALFGSGVLLCLSLPSHLMRVELIKTFLRDTLQIRQIDPHSRQAQALGFSAYSGVSLLAQGILSASMVHFIFLGLFWKQYAAQFDWKGWFYASLLPMVVIVIGYSLVLRFFFGNLKSPPQDEKRLQNMRAALGPISSSEVVSACGMCVVILGLATSSIHKLPLDLIALSILLFFLIFHFVGKYKFRDVINWELLIFVCGLSGLAYTANDIGLIKWIEGCTEWVPHYLHNHFVWSATCMFLITQAGQIVLPRDLNINLLCVVFIPIFQSSGLCPWLAVYIISTAGRVAFFRYQEVEYQAFASLYEKAPDTSRKIWLARIATNIFIILSIYVGIYYWRWIGILSW